jgi:putative ATP-dependent endonuclease of OLD family
MNVTSVRIRNFRGIKDLHLDLGDVTVLIGENNSGKTSVLDALRLCLRDLGPRGRVVFDALDFHLSDVGAEPSSAAPIEIDIKFAEKSSGEWDDEVVGRFSRDGILQVDDSGLHHLHLHVECRYDPERRDFVQDWSFLNLSEEALTSVDSRVLARLQREVPYHYLRALRDAARHFDAKGPFWRPFLQDSQLSVEKKTELEQKLREVNDLVVASHASFEKVQEGLSKVRHVVPLSAEKAVSIEAVPGRIFDMLSRAQIHLGTTTEAQIPVGRHGEGTQSLAVLMLFSAFLGVWQEGAPMIALEEPEAHLHPSAIRALWQLVRGFVGQKLISTHSGDLLAETDVRDIRRLCHTRHGIKAFRVPEDLLSNEETRKISYHIRHARGELLFARCWLLVEGETEIWVYSAAGRALGENLHRDGIRLVEYRQSDVGVLAKIANAFGIAWYCVGDDDDERQNTEPKVRANLGSAGEQDRLTFPYVNIETHLLANGYDGVYSKHMPRQNLLKINSRPGDNDYWKDYAANLPRRAKTRAAADVAIELENRGEGGVTREIRDVLTRAVSIVRGE